MTEFFKLIFSPGMLPFTILLILVVGYWSIVAIGLMDIEIFDFGDFGLDGAVDEAGEALEAAGEGVSIFDAILGFLSVGSVPVSVIFSIFTVQMWFIAFFMNLLVPESLRAMVPAVVFFLIVGVLAALVSLFLTGMTTKPFRKFFKNETTHGHQHLVGKICKIKSSEVTDSFGQAELKIDHSHLLLSVRCFAENDLKNGEEAVITSYNKENNYYEVKEF